MIVSGQQPRVMQPVTEKTGGDVLGVRRALTRMLLMHRSDSNDHGRPWFRSPDSPGEGVGGPFIHRLHDGTVVIAAADSLRRERPLALLDGLQELPHKAIEFRWSLEVGHVRDVLEDVAARSLHL